MKTKIFFIIFFTFFFFNCKNENITPEIKLNNIISNFLKKTSISYDLDFRIKYFDYPDTTNISAKTILIREESDTLFGGYIWFSKTDEFANYIKYYDLKSFYIINNKTKVVTRYNPKNPIPYGFKANFDGRLLNTYFLKQNNLKKLFKDTTYKKSIIEQKNFLKIKLNYPDNKEISNMKRELFLDNSNSSIRKIVLTAELDNLSEFNEWNLKNINFDNYKPDDLVKKFNNITKDYTFKEFNPIFEDKKKPLQNGEKVSDFKGEFLLNNKKEFNLYEFSGNIIILDFWYKTCPPCIKSIPDLNKLYEKHKSKGVKLFGINDIDIDSLSKEQLITFSKMYNIKYPIVLVDNFISEKFKVIGYPTLYVINKKGEIVYSKLGYSKNLEKEIDSVLSAIIK